MFFKIVILKIFAIFTGKDLCWSYFLIKLQAWRSAILIKRDPTTGISWEYCKIFKNTYFEVQLHMAASILLIVKLVAELLLIKNITWNGFY